MYLGKFLRPDSLFDVGKANQVTSQPEKLSKIASYLNDRSLFDTRCTSSGKMNLHLRSSIRNVQLKL